MRMLWICIAIVTGSLFFISCRQQPPSGLGNGVQPRVTYTGVRASTYGVYNLTSEPRVTFWKDAITTMSGYFPELNPAPAAIWVVGVFHDDIEGVGLEFPSNGHSYPHIRFAESDRHEEYLTYFDTHGIKVFLQVEPGKADVGTLIDLVLDRYGHHPSVIGFGVDVEWFCYPKPTAVSNAVAQLWETRVQSHKRAYTLFLKHWDIAYMPSNYRGSIVFINDSQNIDNEQKFLNEMDVWAKRFYPNTVIFQYGYPSDKKWWGGLSMPPQTIGRKLAQQTLQEFGLFWVNFSPDTLF